MKGTVIGTKELIAKFNKLGEAARGKALENSLVAGGLLISNSAKDKAPYKTGTLKRSIHVGGHTAESSSGFTTNDEGGEYSDVGGNKNTQTGAEILVGTNLDYARRIEFGFSGADSLGRVFNQPAQAYLRPALDEEKENVNNEIGAALKVLIDKASK
jgi:HK97 gp10 family phage protein